MDNKDKPATKMSKEITALSQQLKLFSQMNAEKIIIIDKLKNALSKLSCSASIILDPLDEEEITHPVYAGLKDDIEAADELLNQLSK